MNNKKKEPTLEEYIEEKIRMIKEEFFIELTEGEILYMETLKTKQDVDQYAHDIFMRKL